MKYLFGIIFLFSVVIFLIYYGFNASYTPPAITEGTKLCLEKLKVTEIDWQTAVFTDIIDTDVPKNNLWREFNDIGKWNTWASSMHVSASWKKGKEFAVDNQFNATNDYGFPLSKRKVIENIFLAEKQSKAAWYNETDGIKTCHAWYFIPMKDGRTKIINTAVYQGKDIGWAKPFINSPWQSYFTDDIKGLIRVSISN